MKTPLLIFFIFIFTAKDVYSEDTIPQIGQRLPNFYLKRVTNYSKGNVSLDDFRGKWLFIDFWFTGCSNCIKSFPKINIIQKEFQNELNWILVGVNNYKHDPDSRFIERLYEKLRIKQNLKLITAYDSILYRKWGVWSMPHIIIVDPEGVVVSITGGRDITIEKIRALISGKNVSFFPKNIDVSDLKSNVERPDEGLLYKSQILRWNGERQAGYELSDFSKLPAEFQRNGWFISMVPLYMLYNQAYFGFRRWWIGDSLYGKAFCEPILELSDSTLFQYDYGTRGQISGMYNYALYLDSSRISQRVMMDILQNDLKNTFGFYASVQKRSCPVVRLISTDTTLNTKLISRSSKSSFSKGSLAAGFKARNISVDAFLTILINTLGEADIRPFFNETGINGNIDIDFDANMYSFEDVQYELAKYGLALVTGSRDLDVVVIKDVEY